MDTLLGLYVGNQGKLPMRIQVFNKVFTIVRIEQAFVPFKKQRFRFVTDTGDSLWGDKPLFRSVGNK